MTDWRPEEGWEKITDSHDVQGRRCIDIGADAMLAALRKRNSCVFIEGIRITIKGGTVVFIPDAPEERK